MLCFTEKLEAIKEPKENAIDEKENGEGLTNGERQTDEMIDTSDKKIIVGDDIKIILKDDENDNKLEDIHKSDSLNHVQNNMDDVGKYFSNFSMDVFNSTYNLHVQCSSHNWIH